MLFAVLEELLDVQHVDGIELRLDRFKEVNLNKIRNYIEKSPIPVLVTGSTIHDLNPDYIDLDYRQTELFERYAHLKIICSYHNYEETPEDLEGILSMMQRPGVHAYKIACFANSTSDSLRMLKFAKGKNRLTALCMGDKGVLTRFARYQFINYAYVKNPVAPGQLSIGEMDATLFGLIGDPVDKSIGAIVHQAAFKNAGRNALYLKIPLTVNELSIFLEEARHLNFVGLSVTAPLKEAILPYLDEIESEAKQIGAVNTLLFKNGKIYGYNTDGKGALNALEKKGSVKGKKVAIFGAGGAARAIAFEAKKRGADVYIFNRTPEKAIKVAKELGVRGGETLSFCDIAINATSSPSINCPIQATIAMDVHTLPKETPFLANRQAVYGYEMYIDQACLQTQIWGTSSDGIRETVNLEIKNASHSHTDVCRDR